MQQSHPDPSQFLGARLMPDRHVQFCIWAPSADSLKLELRSHSWLNGENESVHGPFAARSKATAVWELMLSLDALGLDLPLYYRWTIERQGKRTRLLDPWAKACDAFDGSLVPWAALLPESAWAHQPIKPDGSWYQKPSQAVIYEAHVRDLSMDPSSPVPEVLRGSYAGAVWALDAIASLGVSHLQILPIQLFGRTDETRRSFETGEDPRINNYNWGYDPLNYFIPSGWYARDPADPASRVRDLRFLVDEAHRRGLRVILDVVYNHAFATESWEAMAPGYWFRKDAHGHLRNHSGCGNDFETTQALFRRLMIESLLWMVKAYDFDGFRFDLMGLIDRQTLLDSLAACQAVKPDILFLGEGWRMYDGPAGTMGMDQDAVAGECPIAVFSDEFRDLIKGGGLDERLKAFLHGVEPDQDYLPGILRGSPSQRFTALHPWNNVNYLECHDGLTAHDNLAFNLRLDPRQPEQKREILSRLAIGLFLQAFSQGICFLHAGQEFGRSKALELPQLGPADSELAEMHEVLGGFVRNSYRSGDAVNAWLWHPDSDRQALRAWTATLLEIRCGQPLFWDLDAPDLEAAFHWHPQTGPVLAWSLETPTQVCLMAANSSLAAATLDLRPDLGRELAAAAQAGQISQQLGSFAFDPELPYVPAWLEADGRPLLDPLGTLFLAWSR